jgi:hypothetical protein
MRRHCTPIPRRCCRRCPYLTVPSNLGDSASCFRERCQVHSVRRADAGCTRAARKRSATAPSPSRCCRRLEGGTGWRVISTARAIRLVGDDFRAP